jgi:dihydrofolate reductase / thymidylate synthase
MSINLLAVITKNYAIRYSDKIPWEDEQYYEWFKEMTKGDVIVMGRKTFEELPQHIRPIQGRLNVVMSNEFPRYSFLESEQLIFTNAYFLENKVIPENTGRKIWFIGGKQIFDSFSNKCQHAHIVWLDKSVKEPQLMFSELLPDFELMNWSKVAYSEYEKCNYRYLKFTRNFNSKCPSHEVSYMRMMNEILKDGIEKEDRTGVGTVSLFGGQQKYDVSKFLPILTTKFVPIKLIIKELLWFLRGDTDAKKLQKEGVHIWDGNSTREFLDKRGLTHYREGELGPIYSFQWRHFGAEYHGTDADYTGKGVDQISAIYEQLKNDPFSRRIILSAWNPTDLDKMALPPCHVMFQLYVEEDKVTGVRHLSGHLYQRSSDYFLAANYNLVSYTILLYIFAKKLGYKPRNMFMSFGDRHLYKNHIEQAKQQLQRNPRPQPILELSESIIDKSWEDINIDDFDLVGYLYHPAIKADMAV